MRTFIYFIFSAILLTTISCAGTNKSLRSGSKQNNESNVSETSGKTILMPATPIKEVEEKIVPDNARGLNNHKYFVIIGSFRNPENAKKYQTQISDDGFVSEVLKNDKGLYRVSVMSTDNIDEARTEIRSIWAKYKRYSDTWLLKRRLQ